MELPTPQATSTGHSCERQLRGCHNPSKTALSPTEGSPEALRHRIAGNVTDPESAARDCLHSPPQGTDLDIVTWPERVLTHRIPCFWRTFTTWKTRWSQSLECQWDPWSSDILFILSLSVSFCPNTSFLFSLSLFSFLSHVYNQIKPILLTLAHSLVCTLLWVQTFLITF